MLFSAEKERVGEDRSLEVSSEENFDLARGLDVSWGEIWKLSPFFKNVISYPVSELVYTSTLCFLICRTALTFTTFLATFDDTLGNVVISLCARNFSEETNRASSGLFSKVLQASLDSPGLNLTETNASPLVDLRVSSQIGDITNGTNFSSLGFSALFTFFSSCLLL
jgi:hypothetical protein